MHHAFFAGPNANRLPLTAKMRPMEQIPGPSQRWRATAREGAPATARGARVPGATGSRGRCTTPTAPLTATPITAPTAPLTTSPIAVLATVLTAVLTDGPGGVRTVTPQGSARCRADAVPGAPEVIRPSGRTGSSSVSVTGSMPASVTAAPVVVDILHNQPELPRLARTRTRKPATTACELDPATGGPAGAVVPVVPGPPEAVLRVALIRMERGTRAGRLRPPPAPAGRSCPRLTARANLSSDDLAVTRGAFTAVAEMKVTM
ncbi:hypothetical protein FHS43_006866 [Streptosporangium becharense]|uniref:Uncharacterized protein n=1 Tax=Streptosporangium becharense TaxID=1816182 RepID=A0A7W9MI96_9ACTN|nr:hypothetical protein [Streptosporangium becharense]MBB5821293.1 hypothetical protein [Streptosporangium becharense]